LLGKSTAILEQPSRESFQGLSILNNLGLFPGILSDPRLHLLLQEVKRVQQTSIPIESGRTPYLFALKRAGVGEFIHNAPTSMLLEAIETIRHRKYTFE
jgi:hypothetical protein